MSSQALIMPSLSFSHVMFSHVSHVELSLFIYSVDLDCSVSNQMLQLEEAKMGRSCFEEISLDVFSYYKLLFYCEFSAVFWSPVDESSQHMEIIYCVLSYHRS